MKKYLRLSKRAIILFSFLFSANAFAQWSNVGGNLSSNNTYPANYSFTRDGNNNFYTAFADLGNQYIVTVKKLVNSTWTNVGTPGFITGTGNSSGLFYCPGTSIAVNPVDNLLYIALSDGDHDNKISVMKFNGTAWVYVGSPGFSTPSACGVKLLFSSTGTPYISFYSCYDGSGISVMGFNGLQWNFMGLQNFAFGNYVRMAVAPDNTISVAFQDQDYSSKISVMSLINGAWIYAGNPGFSDDAAENISITADANNALYTSYTDYSHANKITVKKLTGTTWTTIGDPSFSNFDAHFTDIKVNVNSIPYVTYVDHIYPVAKKFKNGAWINLGNYITTTSCNYTSMVIDTLGNPYVLMALTPSSSTLPFVSKYLPCSDTDYHFTATAILDSAIAYGSDSTTLKVSATGGAPSYTGTGTFKVAAGYYTYTVTDKNGCTTTVSINVPAPCTDNYWTGNVNTAWENAGNWSCGVVPNNYTIVYVTNGNTNYPVVNSIVTCKQVIVSPNANVTVSPGAKLNITGHN